MFVVGAVTVTVTTRLGSGSVPLLHALTTLRTASAIKNLRTGCSDSLRGRGASKPARADGTPGSALIVIAYSTTRAGEVYPDGPGAFRCGASGSLPARRHHFVKVDPRSLLPQVYAGNALKRCEIDHFEGARL